MPGAANPQALNRYSYVRNNPIRYNDPTGHMCSDPEDPTPSCDGSGTPPPTTPLPNPGGGDDDDNGNNNDDVDLAEELALIYNNSDDLEDGILSEGGSPDGDSDGLEINWNAVIDPLAWEHIAGGIIGGVVLAGFGAMIMIPIGVDLCVSIVGCVAGIPLVVAGGAAILGGGVLIWSGVKFTEVYLDEIFEIEP